MNIKAIDITNPGINPRAKPVTDVIELRFLIILSYFSGAVNIFPFISS